MAEMRFLANYGDSSIAAITVNALSRGLDVPARKSRSFYYYVSYANGVED